MNWAFISLQVVSFWLFAFSPVILLVKSFHYAKNGIKAKGKIEKYKVENFSSRYSKTIQRPTISYIDDDGNKHKVLSDMGYLFRFGKPGTEVNILYDRNDPQRAIVNRFLRVWGLPCYPVFLCIMFLLILFLEIFNPFGVTP